MSEIDTTLPDWAVTELRRPVSTNPEQHDRIMELVRVAPRPRRRASAAAFQPRWFRRGMLSPSGAAMAAALTAVMTFMSYPHTSGAPVAMWSEATVIGDTVVAEPVTSRLASAIADTLRIVRFALRAPSASRVALSGDFNAWSSTATQLTHDKKTGMWTARIAVPRSARSYAFVVNGDEWVGAPTPTRAMVDSATRADSI
jgi:hypothetical protein